jgi:4-amino-4-deoxy-L-arabinose transferase-like glycosyltransferase
MVKNRTNLALLVIAGLALALRLWAIDFGLPYQYQQDEAHEVFRALRLGKGDFDFERRFKGGYFYLLFSEYAAYYLYLLTTSQVSGLEEFATKFVVDPTPFWLIGRLTTVLFGTLSVIALYRLGKKAFNRQTGLWAAALLAVAVLHTEHSHYITVDVPMTFFLILAFSTMVDVSRGGGKRASILSGLFIALAMLFKATAVVALIPFAVAHVWGARQRRWRISWQKEAVWGLAVLAVVYVAGNPGILVAESQGLGTTLKFIFSKGESSIREIDPVFLVHYTAGASSLWTFYLQGLWRSLGAVGLGLSILAVLSAMRRLRREEILVISFILPYFLLISASKTLTGPHYLLPLLPLLAVLASRLGVRIVPPTARHSGAIILPAILVAQPFYNSVRFDAYLARPDTRTLAKQWVEENIPTGTKIVIDKGRYRSHWAPPLAESRQALERMLAVTDDPGKRDYLRRKMQHVAGITYDLVSTVWGTEARSVEEYRAGGVEYIVVSEDVRRRFHQPEVRRLFPKAAAFYDSLDRRSDVILVSTFDPQVTGGPGPTIRIYRIVDAGTLLSSGGGR